VRSQEAAELRGALEVRSQEATELRSRLEAQVRGLGGDGGVESASPERDSATASRLAEVTGEWAVAVARREWDSLRTRLAEDLEERHARLALDLAERHLEVSRTFDARTAELAELQARLVCRATSVQALGSEGAQPAASAAPAQATEESRKAVADSTGSCKVPGPCPEPLSAGLRASTTTAGATMVVAGRASGNPSMLLSPSKVVQRAVLAFVGSTWKLTT